MIKTIIFDYAGVLTPTRDNYIFAKKYHAKFGLSVEELMNITYSNWEQARVSRKAESRYWSALVRELKVDKELLLTMILETFPLNLNLINLIRDLKNRYKLVLASNQVEDWLEKVIEENRLREVFDYTLNSYDLKAAKPEEKFFKKILEYTKSLPEESLLIDDSTRNVNAAKLLEMKIIHYKNLKQFKAAISSYLNYSL